MKYGQLPLQLGEINIVDSRENFKCLYLPIKMKNDWLFKTPSSLDVYQPIIEKIRKTEGIYGMVNKYVYITVKNTPVKKGEYHKREGWHCDGFLSDDITYIWSNVIPTIFNMGDFNIKFDHKISMEQFEEQAKDENNITFGENKLLRLNPYVVHKVQQADKDYKQRIFVKVNISEHKYNLAGNTHNDLFNYSWKMWPRNIVRNDPIYKESDYFYQQNK